MRKLTLILALAVVGSTGLTSQAQATEEDNVSAPGEGGGKKWHVHSDGTVHCYDSGGKCIT